MKVAARFRQFAVECRAFAGTARETDREKFLLLAKKWDALANQREQTVREERRDSALR